MSANGELTLAELSTVAPGVQLATHAAVAYRRMVAAFWDIGVRVEPARGVGSGYRSFKVQQDFRAAYLGDAAAAKRVGLNPSSRIPVAAAGYSSHGFGTRIDLLFNGSSFPSAAQLKLAAKFGFTREFGADDPNHFMHDGVTAITPPAPAHLQEDDVVDNIGSGTYTPAKPLPISTTGWTSWAVDAKGTYSIYADDFDGLVDIDVATRIEHLAEGSTVQARFAVVTLNSKGAVVSVSYSDVVELHGSGGAAFPAFSDKVRVHKGQRVRLLFAAQAPGAVLVRVGLSVARFKVA